MAAPPGDSHEQRTMPSPSSQVLPAGSGPFTLRSLLEDVPLVTDDTDTDGDVEITCVDYLGGCIIPPRPVSILPDSSGPARVLPRLTIAISR